MKDTKRRFETFSFFDHTGIALPLAKMAEKGWILAATASQMQIFYNERNNPIPIETDSVLEIETTHAAAKKSYQRKTLFQIMDGLIKRSLLMMPFMPSWTKTGKGYIGRVMLLFCALSYFHILSRFEKFRHIIKYGRYCFERR